MRNIIFLLLMPLAVFSQDNKNVSVISAGIIDVVYRGFDNPMRIVIPNTKSIKAIASAGNLVKLDNIGNYKFSPGSGTEVRITVEAILNDGLVRHEEKVFQIKNVGAPCYTLNAKCDDHHKISRAQLITAEVGIEVQDCHLFKPGIIKSFNMKIPGEATLKVYGSKFSDEAVRLIRKTKPGTMIIISEVSGKVKDYFALYKQTPLVITITN